MLRERRRVGAISCQPRREAGPFTDRQIALLKTFADQAVIAIENVRLFAELETRNRDLTEALEQQTATAEILQRHPSSPTDVQPVFDTIAEQRAPALRCRRRRASFTYDGALVHLRPSTTPAPSAAMPCEGCTRWCRRSRRWRARAPHPSTVHIPDVRSDPRPTSPDLQDAGLRSVLGVPMLREDSPSASSSSTRGRHRPFTDTQIDLLKTFADQAVIAIENVAAVHGARGAQSRADRDTGAADRDRRDPARHLELANGHPARPRHRGARAPRRLCDAFDVRIFRLDDDRLRLVAHHGPINAGPIGEFTVPLVRGTVGGRSVLDARPLRSRDLPAEVDEFPEGAQNARRVWFPDYPQRSLAPRRPRGRRHPAPPRRG